VVLDRDRPVRPREHQCDTRDLMVKAAEPCEDRARRPGSRVGGHTGTLPPPGKFQRNSPISPSFPAGFPRNGHDRRLPTRGTCPRDGTF
jgi:hypothetical protein